MSKSLLAWQYPKNHLAFQLPALDLNHLFQFQQNISYKFNFLDFHRSMWTKSCVKIRTFINFTWYMENSWWFWNIPLTLNKLVNSKHDYRNPNPTKCLQNHNTLSCLSQNLEMKTLPQILHSCQIEDAIAPYRAYLSPDVTKL